MGQEKVGKKWRYYFRHNKQRIQSKAIYRTKTEAKEAEAENRKRIKGPPPKDSTDITFLELCDLAVDRWTEDDHDAEWIETKKYIIKKYFQDLLPLKWIEIEKESIRQKMLEWKKDVSAEAANRYLKILRIVFNVAVKDEIIPYNPANGIDFSARTDKKKKKDYIPTPQEVDKILLISEPMDQRFIICVYHLLARVFEIFRMKWEDVDFRKNTVTLWTRKKRTRSWSDREIPMNEDVRDALLWVKKHSDPDNPFVFPNPDTAKPYIRRPKLLKGLCKKAGVRQFIWRGLRKCSATEMYYDKGVPLLTISELLGHESIETTRIYLGITDEKKRDAVNSISRKCPKSAPESKKIGEQRTPLTS